MKFYNLQNKNRICHSGLLINSLMGSSLLTRYISFKHNQWKRMKSERLKMKLNSLSEKSDRDLETKRKMQQFTSYSISSFLLWIKWILNYWKLRSAYSETTDFWAIRNSLNSGPVYIYSITLSYWSLNKTVRKMPRDRMGANEGKLGWLFSERWFFPSSDWYHWTLFEVCFQG